MSIRTNCIERIKQTINIIGEVVLENVDIAELCSIWRNLHYNQLNYINYDVIRQIGRVYLDKENSDLYIDTISCNGIIVANGMEEDEDLNQFAYINYEFLSDEILEKIMGILIQVTKI